MPSAIGRHGLHCTPTLAYSFISNFHLSQTHFQISVNASILSDTGGTCVCTTNDLCTNDPVYLNCVAEVRQDLITATAAISALASFLMGVLANIPVGLAPGLGLNAYVRA